jgi:hypothetical protein
MRVALLLTLLLAACNKPKVQDCDKATRNYFKLKYWEEAEAQIAAAPESEREALRIQKQEELEPRMMRNIDLAVNKCVSGANNHRVQCWIKATTVKEAEACHND